MDLNSKSPPHLKSPLSGEKRELSPVLGKKYNRKQWSAKISARRSLGEKSDKKPYAKGSNIPVPIKDTPKEFPVAPKTVKPPDSVGTSSASLANFKEEVINKCSQAKHSPCFSTAVGNPISISESTFKKYTDLFSDLVNANNRTGSDSRVPHFRQKCSARYPQFLPNCSEFKCASGDASDESEGVEVTKETEHGNIKKPNNLDMLYENSKFEFGQTSKTTVDSDEIAANKLLQNFNQSDSSAEMPQKFVPTSLASGTIEEENDTPLKSQLNYNIITDESENTFERELDELRKVLKEKKVTKGECSSKNSVSINMSVTGSPSPFKKRTKKKRIIEGDYKGFTAEEIEASNQELNLLVKNKRRKKSVKTVSPKKLVGEATTTEISDLSSKSIKMESNKTNEAVAVNGKAKESLVNSISLPPNNTVQICIGKYTINIKAPNNDAEKCNKLKPIDGGESTGISSGSASRLPSEVKPVLVDQASQRSQTSINEGLTGFSTANGKPIKVNAAAFGKAEKIFQAIDDQICKAANKDVSQFYNKESNDMGDPQLPTKLIVDSEEETKSNILEVPDERKIFTPKSVLERSKSKSNPRKVLDFSEHSKEEGSRVGDKTEFVCGFRTASGKILEISQDQLAKAKKKFSDIEVPDNSAVSGVSLKTIEKSEQKSRNQLFVDIKEVPKTMESGFSSASGKPIVVSAEKFANAANIFANLDVPENGLAPETVQDEKENLSGFTTASGKSVKITKEKLSKANKLFDDLDLTNSAIFKESNLPMSKQETAMTGFSTASGKHIEISSEKLSKANNLFADLAEIKLETSKNESSFPMSKQENNPSVTGFSTASGKLIEISSEKLSKANNLFADLAVINSETPKKKVDIVSKQQNNVASTGFLTASGKSITISNEKMSKANNLFADLDLNNPETPKMESGFPISKQENNSTMTGFSTASGKQIEMSSEKLSKASNLFADLDSDKKTNNNNENEAKTAEPNKRVYQLIEDVVNSYDSALKKIESPALKKIESPVLKKIESPKTPNTSTLSSKKRLGLGSLQTMSVAKEKLDKAKEIFRDLDGIETNLYKEKKPFNTPRKLNVATPKQVHTPRTLPTFSTSIPKSVVKKPEVPKPEVLDMTPVKRPGAHYDGRGYALVVKEKSSTNLSELKEDIDKEYLNIQKKLQILEARKVAVQNQKEIIERNDAEHTRPRLGVLSKMKYGLNCKTTLVELDKQRQDSVGYFNVAPKLLEVTPRNAPKIHFSYPQYESKAVFETTDGAIVIPNLQNEVGVTEIKNAFQAMPGVDPNLIPKGWVTNHYRWIVWKLSSYERKFPHQLPNCLSIENIIQQLKYRYDREISRDERSALRKILEMDDVSQKRLTLCVADVIQTTSNQYELLLTDGWYGIRTVLDQLLCRQVVNGKIFVGKKLMIQGAELLNAENGRHPLQVAEDVKLQIDYNNTRPAAWHVPLGYHKNPFPSTILLRDARPDGGLIARIKVFIVRVYPLRFLENHNGVKIWRNAKAEENHAREFELEQLREYERIKEDVFKEYQGTSYDQAPQSDVKDIDSVTCPKTLYRLVEKSVDPETTYSKLNASQQRKVMDYKMNLMGQEISTAVATRFKKVQERKRNVTPMLKLLVTDAMENCNKCFVLSVWRPSDEQMRIFSEENCISVYNVQMKRTDDFSSVARTTYELHKNMTLGRAQRMVLPIGFLLENCYKPLFNEFDTVGIVVQKSIRNFDQDLWLADASGCLLYIKILDGSKLCALIDGLSAGACVAVKNLVFHESGKLEFGQAMANHYTAITMFPRQKFLQDGMELFKKHLPEDIPKFLNECSAKVESYKDKVNIRPYTSKLDPSVLVMSADNSFLDDTFEDNSTLPARMTLTDLALSMIDTDQLSKLHT